jgi:hypothetical protein
MKKLLVAFALLVMVSPVMADATVNLQIDVNAADILFLNGSAGGVPAGHGVMQIQVLYEGNGTYSPTGLCTAFGAQVTLSGVNASLFTPFAANVIGDVSADVDGTLPGGSSFLFDPFTGGSVTCASQQCQGSLNPLSGVTFGYNSTSTKASHKVDLTAAGDVGAVVGIFQFEYTGTATGTGLQAKLASLGATTQLLVNVTDQGDTSVTGTGILPTFGFDDNSSVGATTGNNGVNLITPEPATMGLLGLGLVGLVIRRKKA